MTLRAVLALTLASTLLAPSASALSCMAPDMIADLNKAKASDKVYYLLVGNFSAPQIKRPKFNPQNQFAHSGQRSQSVRGTFTGVSLGANPRNDHALSSFPVTVETSCAASWCGEVPRSDQEMIAFVEVADDRPPVLTMAPCVSMHYNYTPERVQTLRRCLDKECAPQGWQ